MQACEAEGTPRTITIHLAFRVPGRLTAPCNTAGNPRRMLNQ